MKIKTSALLAALLALAAAVPAYAQAVKNQAYWQDANGRVWRDANGQCWRTGLWTAAQALPECEGKPAAVPAPAPAPLPAPEAKAYTPPAPAPAPAPAPQMKKVRLDGANFATNSSKILPGGEKRLAEVINAAKADSTTMLGVTGYTDSTGSAALNSKLSTARAESVKAYLVKNGVAADRISTAGKGAADAVGDNKTAAGRALNRRVEVVYQTK